MDNNDFLNSTAQSYCVAVYVVAIDKSKIMMEVTSTGRHHCIFSLISGQHRNSNNTVPQSTKIRADTYSFIVPKFE
jgi:hypothetical protein